MADGTFQELDGEVAVAEETLFQTRIDMPANLVEGDYAAEFFLVRDRKVISTGASTIRVEKTGLERWLYNMARNQPVPLRPDVGRPGARRRLDRRRRLPPRQAPLTGQSAASSVSGAASRARSAVPSGSFGRASA